MQIGYRLIEFCAGAKFVTAGGRQSSLAFQDPINIRLPGIELPLFGVVLLCRVFTSDSGGPQTSFGGSQKLQGVSNLDLNILFNLLTLR